MYSIIHNIIVEHSTTNLLRLVYNTTAEQPDRSITIKYVLSKLQLCTQLNGMRIAKIIMNFVFQ